MPIYEYRCQDCGRKFEVLAKTIEVKNEICPECQSFNTEKLLSAPSSLFRMGKSSDDAVDYYTERGQWDQAAKEAEKLGKSKWEIEKIRKGKGRDRFY